MGHDVRYMNCSVACPITWQIFAIVSFGLNTYLLVQCGFEILCNHRDKGSAFVFIFYYLLKSVVKINCVQIEHKMSLL